MRVCILGDFHSVHVQRWARYFVEHGYDVHGLSYAPVDAPEGVTLHVLVQQSSSRAAGGSGTLPPAWKASVPFGMKVAKVGVQWLRHGLRRTVRAIRPDILHGHFVLEYGFYAALAGWSPLVVSAWGSDLLVHPRTSIVNRALVRYTLRRSALVHTLSPLLSDAARAFGAPAGRILTAPFGIEDALLERQAIPPQGRRVLVSTRSLSAVYNAEMLIKAIDRLRRRYPEVLLNLVGDGPLRQDLERLVDALHMGDHVQFLGFLPRKQMLDVLTAAEVYVSSSLSDGASVSLLEAMGVGLVPVVSDIPANHAWIQHGVNGLLADPLDVEQWVDRLDAALSRHAGWRQEVARRNRELVRARALWSEQMRNMETSYQELVR